MIDGITAIRIRRGDVVFHVHGEQAGAEGIWVAEGQVEGLYDAPVKTTWKTGAFQDGSRQRHHKRLHRDLELGFHVIETIKNAYEFNESAFRQIFDYELDRWSMNPQPTTIEVETTMSGVRKLDVLMYEQPDFTAKLDPIMQQYGNLIMKLRAGQPMWYSDNDNEVFEGTATSESGFITVANPTDQIMYQKWILTRGMWDLPDVQWVGDPGERVPGGPNAERMVEDIPVTETNGGMVIDLDRQELMFRDANNTNALAQMGGRKIFNYAIPPYTPATSLPIAYTAAPTGGARAELVMPMRWSRPWGMEATTIAPPSDPRPLTTRFNSPGTFLYNIPQWADAVDVILIGGGGDGEDPAWLVFPGEGGTAGEWEAITLIRGDNIPEDTTQISGTVAGPGGTSTATAASVTVSAAGGAMGANTGTHIGAGVNPLVFNGVTYRGGAERTTPGGSGNPPGGGGAGGWPFGQGGTGARGQVWLRAYTIEGGS